jgi:hypothetical protein
VGSKNKTTRIVEAMVRNDAPAIMRKAIDMAKAGNERIIKLFIDRLLPKRITEIDVPQINYASDAVDALSAVLDAVAMGQLSPSEGAAVASIVETQRRVITAAEFELRLAAIEAKLKDSP